VYESAVRVQSVHSADDRDLGGPRDDIRNRVSRRRSSLPLEARGDAASLKRVAYSERWAENSKVIAAESAERIIGRATACRRGAVEKTLEACRRDHGEEADGFVALRLPRVRRAARDEYERAGRRLFDPVSEPHAKCAVHNVDHFVERVVDVIRRPLPRRIQGLKHRQGAVRLRRASLEHDLSAERVLDALAGAQRKKDCTIRHMHVLTRCLVPGVGPVLLTAPAPERSPGPASSRPGSTGPETSPSGPSVVPSDLRHQVFHAAVQNVLQPGGTAHSPLRAGARRCGHAEPPNRSYDMHGQGSTLNGSAAQRRRFKKWEAPDRASPRSRPTVSPDLGRRDRA
jgi:hypothetical protein